MIDKRTLIDSVFVQKKLADDKWGKPVFDKPILLSPVRFDRVYSHEGTGNNRTDTKKSSVVLVYPQYCKQKLDKTFNGGQIIDGDDTFIIESIIPQIHPFTKKVFCYEIEVR